MSSIIVEAIRGRCASFMSLPATVSEILWWTDIPIYFSSINDSLCTCTILCSVGLRFCNHISFGAYVYDNFCTLGVGHRGPGWEHVSRCPLTTPLSLVVEEMEC